MVESLSTHSPSLPESKNFFQHRKKFVILVSILILLLIFLSILWVFRNRIIVNPTSKLAQPISSLPPIRSYKDAQNRVTFVGSKFTDSTLAKKYQQELYDAATFTSTKLSPALIENTKAGLYFGTYNQIVGQYYATRDLEVLALAKQLREFIKETYPEKYKTIERTNGWEIKENK